MAGLASETTVESRQEFTGTMPAERQGTQPNAEMGEARSHEIIAEHDQYLSVNC